MKDAEEKLVAFKLEGGAMQTREPSAELHEEKEDHHPKKGADDKFDLDLLKVKYSSVKERMVIAEVSILKRHPLLK